MAVRGQVVKLDRGFPLVRLENGTECRCKHATTLVKGKDHRAVIGDWVSVIRPDDVDMAQIEAIEPRESVFIRKDPAERTQAQVLAANFDQIIVAQPLAEINLNRLTRELVLAHETGAQVVVVLTKADLAESEAHVNEIREMVQDIVGDVELLVVSADSPESFDAVRAVIGPRMAVLIGKSGVGKSSLVNMLVGSEIQATTPVRETNGKGRHTTVSREIIDLPGQGRIVDMPGVRGLGLWDAADGIAAAFADIVELSGQCKFRDCKHEDEPGCAVRSAVEAGTLAQNRLDAYRTLRDEDQKNNKRRTVAERKQSRRGHPRRRQRS